MSGENKLMVATGALGTRVDVSGIKDVIHMEILYGMITFCDESRRAGKLTTKTIDR